MKICLMIAAGGLLALEPLMRLLGSTDTILPEAEAYAGNATYPADERRGNQVDIITSPRSTGSILKPFL